MTFDPQAQAEVTAAANKVVELRKELDVYKKICQLFALSHYENNDSLKQEALNLYEIEVTHVN